MAIVQLRDEYTETEWIQSGNIAPHNPYPLGHNSVLLVRSSPWDSSLSHSRIYTITSGSWTQGDAMANPLLPVQARAGAVTLDGLMLLQVDGGITSVPLSNYWLYDPATGATVTAPATHTGFDGPLHTTPAAMTRIPGTNYFWAWRYYAGTGVLHLDVLLVSGTTITLVGTTLVSIGVNPIYAPNYVPRAIVTPNATEAYSVIAFSDGTLYLIHAVRTSTNPTVTTQQITGYPTAPDPCLYPGHAHPAELMLRAVSGSPTQVRIGITFTGGSFTLTSLPLTQLPPTFQPVGYTGKAVVEPNNGARFQEVDGLLIVGRKFLYDGSDDNWTLLTQYSLSDGAIVANTWTKGDLSGAAGELMQINDIEICWEASSQRLVLGADDYHHQDVSIHARLGLYRISYVIEASSRSHRETFER